MAYRKNTPPGSREFMKNLQNNTPGSVIVLYGVEEYLIRWAVDLLKKKYISPATEVMDFQVLDGNACDPAAIIGAAETFSMLSEKRVVWVRDFRPLKSPGNMAGYGEDGIERLTKYMENPNDGAILVLSNEELDGTRKLAKAARKYGKVYEMGTVSERELVGFAAKRFRELGVTVSKQQMREIITATGYLNKESEYRLYDFVHDIEKLAALAEEGTLRSEDIAGAVNGDKETFLFDLIDGISENNKTRALELLYNRMSDDPYGGIPLVAAIISQMELMYCVKEFAGSMDGPSTAPTISKRMGIHEFRVKKAMRYSSRYSLSKLRAMLQAGYKAYADIVTGLLEPRLALEMFIAQI